MDARRIEHNNHRIEVRSENSVRRALGGEEPTQLLIDGEPVRFGRLPDGLFYLADDAYVWGTDLAELARGVIDRGLIERGVIGRRERPVARGDEVATKGGEH